MFFDLSMFNRAIRIMKEGSKAAERTDIDFLTHEIQRTKFSQEWKWMLVGDDYYRGRQEILHKVRTVIGADGKIEPVENLPNARLADNVYKRMVKQKVNYLLGKPFSITTEDGRYAKALNYFFDKNFFKQLKTVGKDALNCGIGWLYPYYNEEGQFCFKRFRPYEIIPEWRDVDHTQLDSFIRFYDVKFYNGTYDELLTKVEYYTKNGIDFYEYFRGNLVPAEPYHQDYFSVGGKGYNWDRIPLIAFKYNDEEQPLIVGCKSLQDALNQILSTFDDAMNEDVRNTILVLVNYDGENLAEFRKNLATYGAVKVRSADGANGDVRTLQIEVNSDNYKAICDILKRAIIENCMGYDAKDEKMSGTPNQMNIMSMYNDIDLDASDMETEFQAALDDLLYFVDLHLLNSGEGDYSGVDVKITFNTDMPMDEASTIANAKNSVGMISDRTIMAHHPWVTDPDVEMQQLEEEKQKAAEQAMSAYDPFGTMNATAAGEGETNVEG